MTSKIVSFSSLSFLLFLQEKEWKVRDDGDGSVPNDWDDDEKLLVWW